MRNLFERTVSREAAIYAEAQALVDDGLDLAFVLELFPGEEEWLEPQLSVAARLEQRYETEAPSLYFEASLKNQFVAAAARRQRTAPAPSYGAVRSAFAGAAVLTAAGMLGFLTLGVATSDDAVPGEWNYRFKLGRERVEYALARGNGRVDQQIDQTEARLLEVQRLNSRGELAAGDIERLQHEAQDLADLAQQRQFDEIQRARLKALSELSSTVLQDAKTRQPGLEPAVTTTKKTVDDAVVAAGAGSTSPLPTPANSPAPAVSPTPAPEQTASATTTASPSPTAEASPSPGVTPTP